MGMAGTMDGESEGRLWTPDFWRICVAHFLFSVSLHMLWVLLPTWLLLSYSVTPLQAGGVTALYGLSLYLLGPFFSYLADRYRRKSVCLWGILLAVAATGGYAVAGSLAAATALRILQGAAAGLAVMASRGTLVIDISQSPRRTDANEAFAWFGRFGLSIGPLLALLLCGYYPVRIALLVSCGVGMLAFLLISQLHIPFRAPLCPPKFSLDRFWLPNGWPLLLNLLLVAAPMGVFLAQTRVPAFFGLLMAGFLLALLARRFFFTPTDNRTEMAVGILLLALAALLLLFQKGLATYYTEALLAGCGVGLVVPRMLYLFIELSEHCERGAANVMHGFGWELGLSLGFCAGYACVDGECAALSPEALLLIFLTAAFVLYFSATYPWFLRHKKR